MILIQSTNSENIIISSDSDSWMWHRSPYDIVSLGITLGLKKDGGYKSVSVNC